MNTTWHTKKRERRVRRFNEMTVKERPGRWRQRGSRPEYFDRITCPLRERQRNTLVGFEEENRTHHHTRERDEPMMIVIHSFLSALPDDRTTVHSTKDTYDTYA